MTDKILAGKIALVTGAGRGIGKSIAVHLARAGARVVLCDLNTTDLEETAREIKKEGSEVHWSATDVSKLEDVRKMVEKANEKFGRVDILVNNAGILYSTPVLEIKEEEWDKILDVNLKGTFLCTQVVLKGMIERKYGKIISLSSVDYLRGSTPPCLPYGTSKAGVTGFTKTLAREVGKYGI